MVCGENWELRGASDNDPSQLPVTEDRQIDDPWRRRFGDNLASGLVVGAGAQVRGRVPCHMGGR